MWYDTGTAHVRSLAVDGAGRVYAGTGSPGRVLRIDAGGRAFVLLDTNHDEITSIRVAPDGTLLALAAGGAPSPVTAAPAAPAAAAATAAVTTSVSVTVTASATAAPAAMPAAPSAGAASPSTAAGGAVYRIAPDGNWDAIWQSTSDTPYDAAVDADGAVIVGTGPDGKLFRVEGRPPTTVLLTRAPARQVTRLARGPDGLLYYTTANPGNLYRLATNRAGSGAYVSEVHDARTVATWGTIRWRADTPGGSSVRLQTRSGNTAVPSDTWSRWSEPYAAPGGTAISSPNARYLQWRASLAGAGATPALFSVTAAYLPRNLAPEVTRITVQPPGQVNLRSFPTDPPIAGLDAERDPAAPPPAAGAAQTPTLGRQVYRKGLQSFAWDARDPNDDPLEFEVHYREETASAVACAEARADHAALHLGHHLDPGRHLCRARRGHRRRRQRAGPGTDRHARHAALRRRQLAAADHRGGRDAGRGPGDRACAGLRRRSRRWSGWSTRWTPSDGRRPILSTASPISARSAST